MANKYIIVDNYLRIEKIPLDQRISTIKKTAVPHIYDVDTKRGGDLQSLAVVALSVIIDLQEEIRQLKELRS